MKLNSICCASPVVLFSLPLFAQPGQSQSNGYIGETEKNLMTKIRDEVEKEKIWPRPIVTSIEELKNYTVAEDYHQNYFEKYEKASEAERMSMNAGYCNAIIAPKVKKFREKYAAKLKKP